ncbi:hypothetical protein U2W12_17290 [Methylomicrobium sp. Wu6]|nr:hypothetical protein [Methylomicrobium sp. Wu6]
MKSQEYRHRQYLQRRFRRNAFFTEKFQASGDIPRFQQATGVKIVNLEIQALRVGHSIQRISAPLQFVLPITGQFWCIHWNSSAPILMRQFQ